MLFNLTQDYVDDTYNYTEEKLHVKFTEYRISGFIAILTDFICP